MLPKLLTIGIQTTLAVLHLIFLQAAGSDNGFGAAIIAALHCATLLGLLGGPQVLQKRGLWWSPPPDSYGALLLFLIGFVEYLGVGVIAFGKFEQTMTTFTDRLYFVIVLLTTVGYGHTFTPSTATSRLFTVCFSLIGLIAFGAGTSILSEAIRNLVSDVRSAFARSALRSSSSVMPATSSSTSAAAAMPKFQPGSTYETGKDMVKVFGIFLLFNFASAAIFCSAESWVYNDALYHCFMTATTIGLGDIAPITHAGRSFAIIHMVLSVVLFGSMLGAVLGALDRRATGAKAARLLAKQLDEEVRWRSPPWLTPTHTLCLLTRVAHGCPSSPFFGHSSS